MTYLNREQMQSLILDYIFINHRTQKNAARYWGVSEAFVSAVVTGRKAPNGVMLQDVGLIPVKAYLRSVERVGK